LRIVFATTHVPCGERSGGQVVSHAIVQALRSLDCAVTVVGYGDPSAPAPPCCETALAGMRVPETSRAGIGAVFWLMRSLLSGSPYTSAKYVSAGYRQILKGVFEGTRPDLVIVDHTQMAWLLPLVPASVPTVVVLHNAESDLYERGAVHQGNALKRLLYRREARRLRHAERRIATASDCVWLLSNADGASLRSHMREASFRTIAVTPELVPAARDRPPSSYDIGLVGTWSWLPNAEGLEWFLTNVLPHLPDGVSVHVAGPGADRLAGKHGAVTCRGFVDDVSEFLSAARVIAIPTRHGSGVETKTLAAIASGRPVVATPVAVRGLSDLPANVLVADRPADFARCLVGAIAGGDSVANSEDAEVWCNRRRENFLAAVAEELHALLTRPGSPPDIGRR
jgi:glycosyltransferase involved in cell wall biosynthesis